MKIAKCIRLSETTHPAFRVNRFYELLDVVRSGSQYFLTLRLEDGSERMEDPADFIIIDDEFRV